MGDSRAVSAVHKDHYENLYTVIRGEKHFVLFPPADILWLQEIEAEAATYSYNDADDAWSIVLDDAPPVSWIDLDPTEPLSLSDKLQRASPISCIVRPGETLYLPALWYHQVAQVGTTIAVNFWHDMAYDSRYVYYKLCRGIMQARRDSQATDR